MKWPSKPRGQTQQIKFRSQRSVKAQTLHLLSGQSPEPCCPEYHLHKFCAQRTQMLLAFCEVAAATTFPFKFKMMSVGILLASKIGCKNNPIQQDTYSIYYVTIMNP